MIIIPLILVKGCNSSKGEVMQEVKENKLNENYNENTNQITNKMKVYIHDEGKVVDMNLNEYLKGVVAAEMPADFHIEALKAQAVAARTYAYHRINNKEKGSYEETHKSADICTNPAHCKAWISKNKAMDRWDSQVAEGNWEKISRAVDSTLNIIITYNDEPIDAVFHSTSSGNTENSEEVWVSTVPYLRSVPSYGENLSPRYTSEVWVPLEEFKEKILSENNDVTFNEDVYGDIEVPQRTEGGSVSIINIGGCNFKGTEIRRIFGLNSANFTVETDNEYIVFKVIGNGHGVGMSQYGANYFANEGKTYEEILKYYYKDIVLECLEE
jgi:stage II sporulation protein D